MARGSSTRGSPSSGCRRRSTTTSPGPTSFGFQTAVQIATDAIDRLRDGQVHNRVIIVEVMGRHAGWIATYSASPPAAPT